MKINKSPWIHQLDQERKSVELKQDIETDVVIVGAGIAGVSTAFFLLKYTNKKVVLCDKGKLAHGATGHNAGQVVACFERPLIDMVKEFGFEKIKRALHDLHSGWILLDEMYMDANLDILFSRIAGAHGLSDLHQVISTLNDVEIEILSGLPKNDFFISEEAPFLNSIPNNFKHLYKVVPHAEILKRLETDNKQFQAVMMDQRACMNSALFCQEIVMYLLQKYSRRFSLYENTHIKKVVLKKKHTLLDADKHTIGAEKIILCTNGFESFDIFNEDGLAIDKKFHHLIEGKVGYMSGYLEALNKKPAAISYFTSDFDPDSDDPYFYLTRRPHEMGDEKHNLVCVGGPELSIDDREEYLYEYDYPEQMHQDIDVFIREVYLTDAGRKIDYQFTWHGLMGYTPNRVRLIGEEPKNKTLLYNLGCNGIGIIPSIFGGRRISRIIAGEKLNASIFDPRS
ncbi:MAG: FAD-binding oxidoreductase [Patescibacteria group bacterium]